MAEEGTKAVKLLQSNVSQELNYNYNPYQDLSHLSFYVLAWRHLVIVSAPFYAARRFPSWDPVSKMPPQCGATASGAVLTLPSKQTGTVFGMEKYSKVIRLGGVPLHRHTLFFLSFFSNLI